MFGVWCVTPDTVKLPPKWGEFMQKISLMACVALSACGGANGGNEAVAASPTAMTTTAAPSNIINTKAGRYRVGRNPKINPADLPKNSDLKMLDGDAAQYAAKLCGLDFANKTPPVKCELFVQPDKSGLLTGYVALMQGRSDGVRIDTALETDRQKSGTGCFISGKIDNSDFDHPEAPINVSRDFQGRVPFAAWEKSPGDWMVSFNDDEGSENAANGMWYIKRLNSKLRIEQERWNYCYSDKNVHLDEVFTQVLSLERIAD